MAITNLFFFQKNKSYVMGNLKRVITTRVPMSSVEQVLEFSGREHDRYLKELIEYLSIPSISTLPEHKQAIQRRVARSAEYVIRDMTL